MVLTNINYMMNLVNEYVLGKGTRSNFELEFEIEFEARYKRMTREDREYAEVFYDWIYVGGIDAGANMTDATFKRLLKRQYNEVKDIADGGFC